MAFRLLSIAMIVAPVFFKSCVGFMGKTALSGGWGGSVFIRNRGSGVLHYKKKSLLWEDKDNAGGGGGGGGVSGVAFSPKTANQEIYVKHLLNPSVHVVLGVGPAGSGKTMLACCVAIQSLKRGLIDKIVITRPLIPVDEEAVGFLPGNLNAKMQPWTQPIMDIFAEHYTPAEIKHLLANGVIEVSPLAFMRGRTFKKSFIIADEMQNSSPNQMMMMNTRVGEECKLVITGDLKQTDRIDKNGLADFMVKYKTYRDFHHLNVTADDVQIVELTGADILRSAIVTKMIDVYGHVPLADLVTNNVTKKIKSGWGGMSDSALIPEHYANESPCSGEDGYRLRRPPSRLNYDESRGV